MQKNGNGHSGNGHNGNGNSLQGPPRNYLWLKLAALFAATFLVVFMGGLVMDVFGSMVDRAQADAAAEQPAPIVIDPKLKTELNRVMAFDDIPSEAVITDPFVDRGGISTNVKAPAAPQVQQASTTVGGTGGTSSAPTVSTVGGSGTMTASSTQQPAAVSPLEATKDRYASRLERLRMGIDPGPEAQVFAIDDLLPVGLVSGGSVGQEIIFYSQAAGRTFSFPVGARFYDGWLTEVKPEGVVFTFDDQYRTMRMRSWGRSIKGAAAASGVALMPGTPAQSQGTN